MHRYLLITLIVLVIAAAVLTIVQIWSSVISWDVYVKAMITLGILFLLAGFLLVVKSDLGEHKQLKDKNYLD